MSKENTFKELTFVRYVDHVLYHRTSALSMQPQVRETVGWLVYECEQYVTLTWDRDAEPPTLKGGDPKASGTVLLKSDILVLKKTRSPRTTTTRNFKLSFKCPRNHS